VRIPVVAPGASSWQGLILAGAQRPSQRAADGYLTACDELGRLLVLDLARYAAVYNLGL
jgi:hypothetical protein